MQPQCPVGLVAVQDSTRTAARPGLGATQDSSKHGIALRWPQQDALPVLLPGSWIDV